MARRHINFDDRLEERVKSYCDKNGLTFTTFAHMALEHYLNHIELSKDISSLMKDYLVKVIQKEGKDKLY